MPRTSKDTFKLGENWLGKRSGSETWYRYFWDAETGRTRRVSLGTEDFEEAKQALTEWYAREHHPENQRLEDVALADILRIYYEEHAMDLPSHDAARIALNKWLDFFKTATLLEAATPRQIDRFIAHLREQGHSEAYVSRTLSSGRAAINRAYKQGMIQSAPFIKDVKVDAQPPKGRPLELDELRALYHTARFKHLKAFILWMVGTTARPDAVVELRQSQIDLEYRLVHLNPPGRPQTKKYRPTVKLPETLRDKLGEHEYIVNYGGRPMRDLKSSWRTTRAACGFGQDVNPYSIRHTMARHLRAKGVSSWEVAAQLGHKQPGLSTTEIYAPFDPTYLATSVAVIDNYLKDLLVSLEDRPLTLPQRCQGQNSQNAKSLKSMVDAAGIEPATPTMST